MTHSSSRRILLVFASAVAPLLSAGSAQAESSESSESPPSTLAPSLSTLAPSPSSPSSELPPPGLPTAAAAPSARAASLRPSFMLGIGQWTLFGGGNVAAQLKTGRLVLEYSHGQALHYNRVPKLTLTAAERDADVEVEMPWTTGGGIGYQLTPRLHVLLEVKAHHYLLRGAEYTSLTVGAGFFYEVYLTKHFFLQPNLRWWPTVASTFDSDVALMSKGGSTYRPKRHDLPPFINMNVGWTFDAR
jgi:hypothetical protein